LAGLVGEIDQDRTGLEQAERLAAGTVGIEDRRNLVVGAEREELRRHLVVAIEGYEVGLVGEARLLEHDRDLDTIGRGQRIELDAVGMPRRPFPRDGEGGKIAQVLLL
jgi:hypothetical protein